MNSFPSVTSESLGPSYDRLAKAQANVAGSYYAPSMKQRLDEAVSQAEERLRIVKEAREILDRNPDIETLLNLLQRGGF